MKTIDPPTHAAAPFCLPSHERRRWDVRALSRLLAEARQAEAVHYAAQIEGASQDALDALRWRFEDLALAFNLLACQHSEAERIVAPEARERALFRALRVSVTEHMEDVG